MATVTQGKRYPDGTPHYEMEPGGYSKCENGTTWFLVSPVGEYGAVNTEVWKLTENDDETLTVDPSIWFNNSTGWHGHLVDGAWKEVG